MVDRTRAKDVEHAAIREGKVDLHIMRAPFIRNGFHSDPWKTELHAVIPDPRINGLSHLGITGLLRKDELKFVAHPPRQVNHQTTSPSRAVTYSLAKG